jgi:hypothetical protein
MVGADVNWTPLTTMTELPLAKVHIDLPNHWATNGESLWARQLGFDRYQLENVPFYSYDLNYGDVVEAVASAPDVKPSVRRALERSGHQTIRVFFEEGLEKARSEELLDPLRSLGVTYERATARYVALDLEPGADLVAIRDVLDGWGKEGFAEYETCEARVLGSFDDAATDASREVAG